MAAAKAKKPTKTAPKKTAAKKPAAAPKKAAAKKVTTKARRADLNYGATWPG